MDQNQTLTGCILSWDPSSLLKPTNKQTLSENIWWVCILNIHHLQSAESNYLTKTGTNTVGILTHVGWYFCESFSLIMKMRFLQITSLFLSCIEKTGHRHYSVARFWSWSDFDIVLLLLLELWEISVLLMWRFCFVSGWNTKLFINDKVYVILWKTGQLCKKCQIYFWLLWLTKLNDFKNAVFLKTQPQTWPPLRPCIILICVLFCQLVWITTSFRK